MELVRNSYQTLFGTMPNVMVIHAGLECGLFKSAYPEWDMVSFGPTIRGAHSLTRRYISRRSNVSGNCWCTCWKRFRPNNPAYATRQNKAPHCCGAFCCLFQPDVGAYRMPRASRIHSQACWISWVFSLAISIISGGNPLAASLSG